MGSGTQWSVVWLRGLARELAHAGLPVVGLPTSLA
jgi:hypothetical protein